jgi:predicted DNA-binding transcriptional regulator AlpA
MSRSAQTFKQSDITKAGGLMTSSALTPRDLSLPRFALRRDEAAASLAISETTFDRWVEMKRMPPGHKIDGVILWDTQEIRECWLRLKDGETAKNPFDDVTA